MEWGQLWQNALSQLEKSFKVRLSLAMLCMHPTLPDQNLHWKPLSTEAMAKMFRYVFTVGSIITYSLLCTFVIQLCRFLFIYRVLLLEHVNDLLETSAAVFLIQETLLQRKYELARTDIRTMIQDSRSLIALGVL